MERDFSFAAKSGLQRCRRISDGGGGGVGAAALGGGAGATVGGVAGGGSARGDAPLAPFPGAGGAGAWSFAFACAMVAEGAAIGTAGGGVETGAGSFPIAASGAKMRTFSSDGPWTTEYG